MKINKYLVKGMASGLKLSYMTIVPTWMIVNIWNHDAWDAAFKFCCWIFFIWASYFSFGKPAEVYHKVKLFLWTFESDTYILSGRKKDGEYHLRAKVKAEDIVKVWDAYNSKCQEDAAVDEVNAILNEDKHQG